MKKRFVLIILSALCISISGCQNANPKNVDLGELEPDKAVYGQGVTLSYKEYEDQHILNEEDAAFIRTLFSDESRYVQDTPNCAMDCFLNVDGIEIQYHTDCGNLMRMDNGMSMKLTEDEKALVNGVLSKYITLGFEVDERKNEGFVVISDPNSDKPDAHIKSFSEDDANIMFAVLSDEKGFINDLYKCTSDCVVSVNGIMYNYCSSCGTFNDKTNMRGLQLTDSEREVVNEILSRYTPYLNPESEKSSE